MHPLAVLGLFAAAGAGVYAIAKAAGLYGGYAPDRDPRTFELVATDGKIYVWTWAELPDTLFESGLWETDQENVDGLKIGDKLVRNLETLKRIS